MRVKVTLRCNECKQRNYNTMKNKKNTPDKLELNKYCPFCKKHTLHTETKELATNDEKGRVNVMAEEVKKKRSRGQWFREMKSELKKVVWPDRKTVMKNTGTVLLCSLAIGVCIWIFDFVMVTAVQMILRLFA